MSINIAEVRMYAALHDLSYGLGAQRDNRVLPVPPGYALLQLLDFRSGLTVVRVMEQVGKVHGLRHVSTSRDEIVSDGMPLARMIRSHALGEAVTAVIYRGSEEEGSPYVTQVRLSGMSDFGRVFSRLSSSELWTREMWLLVRYADED